MAKLSQYEQTADSVSLAKIDGKPFSIVAVEDSAYNKGTGERAETVPGVKITTKETFKVEVGPENTVTEFNKFHTTRTAVVQTLCNQSIRQAISDGEEFRVKCVRVEPKNGGNSYFVLDDA